MAKFSNVRRDIVVRLAANANLVDSNYSLIGYDGHCVVCLLTNILDRKNFEETSFTDHIGDIIPKNKRAFE